MYLPGTLTLMPPSEWSIGRISIYPWYDDDGVRAGDYEGDDSAHARQSERVSRYCLNEVVP